MHRAKRAVAASATALAAFVLVGGPMSAVAMARPGDSDNSHGGQHAGRGGIRGGHDGPRSDYRQGVGNTGSGGGGSTHRSTATVTSRTPQPAAGAGASSDSRSVAVAPKAAATRPSAGSDAPAAEPVFVAPTPVFGNGRTPGDGATHPVVAVPQPGIAITVPPMVVAAPAPLGALQAAQPPRAELDLAAGHAWDSARPGQSMSSWFGLAGLVLIPLAGAALGYRQARGAKAASELAIR